MNIHLYFSTGNAAFEDGALPLEAARIFQDQANRIEDAISLDGFEFKVYDINGNRVGTFFATESADEIALVDKPLIHAHLTTGNAAFEDAPGAEVARILREAAKKLTSGETEFGLRDVNGNRVGGVEFVAAEPEADNDLDGGDDGEPPRQPLIGDVMKDEHGDAWTLVRTKLVSNRKGYDKMEPLFIVANNEDANDFRFLYAEQMASTFGTELERTYGYIVNLDERGEFYADVRQEDGESIFEVRTEDDGTCDLVQDGFMDNVRDVKGLANHLREQGLMAKSDRLLDEAAYWEYESAVTSRSQRGEEAWMTHNAPRAIDPYAGPSP
ncbi:hypothetical protein [Ralstonia sp. ASV6]|uniref:hypothetical protein n=1 Tax=Ralstonia sp. ASV6 TaxID=2795124 RepID=UPI0018EB935A|nr:hypothetical protein [Ralstonia sp. ASV6]